MAKASKLWLPGLNDAIFQAGPESGIIKDYQYFWRARKMCKMPKNHGKSLKAQGCCTLGTDDHTESGIKTKQQTTLELFAFNTMF